MDGDGEGQKGKGSGGRGLTEKVGVWIAGPVGSVFLGAAMEGVEDAGMGFSVLRAV